jgi:hypothetical protein
MDDPTALQAPDGSWVSVFRADDAAQASQAAANVEAWRDEDMAGARAVGARVYAFQGAGAYKASELERCLALP